MDKLSRLESPLSELLDINSVHIDSVERDGDTFVVRASDDDGSGPVSARVTYRYHDDDRRARYHVLGFDNAAITPDHAARIVGQALADRLGAHLHGPCPECHGERPGDCPHCDRDGHICFYAS